MAGLGALWRKNAISRQNASPVVQTKMSRRATVAGGASAFAAAFALAACSADNPRSETAPVLTPRTNANLYERLNSAQELVVFGVDLNLELLRRFYARHDFAQVWTIRRAQADALITGVLHAGSHGLSLDLFHITGLRQEALPPLERDLLLSDAFLKYADALARGAVPVEHRVETQILAPEPIDVAAVLDSAIASDDPAGVIEALAPTTPTYAALRQALKKHRSGTPASRMTPTERLRSIVVNLERQRWLPRPLPATRAWVNVADEQLVLYRAGQPVLSTRVVVGEDVERNQSPEFRATIDASFYNPPWVIPVDIAAAEILPKLRQDPDFLKRNKMVLLANGEVEQLPGPDAGLGLIMFDMPNRFDVYLHDTPDRNVFSRDNRRISHGCIRVENPREFAALLMDQSIGTIDQGIAAGSTTRNPLPTPVPVFVVYQTAFVDTGGLLQFRRDFYNRDYAVWRSLQEGPRREALAAKGSSGPMSAKAL